MTRPMSRPPSHLVPGARALPPPESRRRWHAPWIPARPSCRRQPSSPTPPQKVQRMHRRISTRPMPDRPSTPRGTAPMSRSRTGSPRASTPGSMRERANGLTASLGHPERMRATSTLPKPTRPSSKPPTLSPTPNPPRPMPNRSIPNRSIAISTRRRSRTSPPPRWRRKPQPTSCPVRNHGSPRSRKPTGRPGPMPSRRCSRSRRS